MCSVLVSDSSDSKQVINKGPEPYVHHSWSPGLVGLYPLQLSPEMTDALSETSWSFIPGNTNCYQVFLP